MSGKPNDTNRFLPELCRPIIERLKTDKVGVESLDSILSELNEAHLKSNNPELAKKRVLKQTKKSGFID